ncbi:MAG: D-alanyl-D-alanine carboxypeptidase/D-alanyl-D-alanine-endopeptidase [Planctomycetota bacterium]|nr:D-alanyl-D-alanine carboxypeptidase/D-alanyl-D-alanine-endopeptidase [Planctomycetota bacterium]
MTRNAGRARVARIALLLAVNAALIGVAWKVAVPRLLARDQAPAVATAGTSIPSSVAAVASPYVSEPSPVAFGSRRDRALEERIRVAIQDALIKAETESKGRARRSEIAVAVHVRSAADGAEIATIGAERAQRPASNLKLVTTGAALVLLGPDWRFQTFFTSEAAVENGVLRGDLVVRAGGDPLYDPNAAGDVEKLLAPAIGELRAAGITRVAGDLVLDEGRFLEPGPGPAWPASGQRWDEFCALTGGFNANAGCLTARVRPGKVGAPARVEVRPLGHGLPQKIDVRTGPAKSRLDVRVSAINGTVIVEGSFPANVDSWECRFAAPDPVALFGGALRHALSAQGIEVAGSVRRERATPKAGARPLAKIETPILSVLEPINAHSNNACADQLFFALGNAQFGTGDRSGGRQATSLALQRLGVPDDGFQQVDGSGLSRDNQVSARQITALLAGVLRRGGRASESLLASMAAPKADGTLDDRLAGLEGRVRAKTGFIGGTSALSGVIETDGGRSVCFSILVEYPVTDGLNTRVWKPMQDRICRILAGVRE